MAERLRSLGYTRPMVEVHLQFASSLSKYLLRRKLTVGDLNPELIEQFVGELRAKNRSWRPTSKALSWLVDFLSEVGVIAALVVPRAGTASRCCSSDTATT